MKQPKPPTKQCLHCNADLQFWTYENDNTGMVYQCINCPVQTILHYHKDVPANLDKIVYVIDRQGHLYTWTDNYTKRTSYITDVTSQVEHLNNRNPVLIDFPKFMNVTPATVREKFGFYMVFL